MLSRILLVLALSVSIATQAKNLDSLKAALKVETDDSTRAELLYMISHRSYREKPDSCLLWINESMELFTKVKHEKGIAHCHQILGVLAKNKGQFEVAISHYLKSTDIYERLGLESFLSISLNDLGVLHKNLKQYDKALKFYRQSVSILNRQGITRGKAMLLNNIGTIFDAQSNLDSAAFYYNQAAQIATEGSFADAMAVSFNNLGELEMKRGNNENALEFFVKTLRLDKGASDIYGQCFSHTNLANAYSALGKYETAITHLDTAISHARELEANDLRANILKVYSSVYEAGGQPIKALEFFKEYEALNDSLRGAEVLGKVEQLQLEYETEKKEKEIAQLRSTQAESALQTARQRTLFIIALAAAILTIGALGFAYYRRQQQTAAASAQRDIEMKKQLLDTTVIAQEEERQRIAKDLHDGLVQSLAAVKMGLQKIESSQQLPPEVAAQLHAKTTLVDEAANEARNISHQMMPRVLTESGLVAAMDDMLHKTLAHTDIQFRFDHFGIGPERFKPTVEIGLYRICQEMVNNVIKHSGATELSVQLLKSANHLVMHVEDNGRGFDASKSGGGIGMSNIFSRASAVNGEVHFEPGSSRGTAAHVRVPLV